MSEPSFKTFSRQAERFYERGVAAARGGQRTLAAGLLRQAVKLNPQHEQAWLWLGGVLDDPDDITFCLQAALGINPQNERARRGLALLAERAAAGATPKQDQPHPVVAHTVAPPALGSPAAPDPWWASFREARVQWRWTFRLIWMLPIVLIVITLSIRAIIVARPIPEFVTYEDLTPAATPVLAAAERTIVTEAPTPVATIPAKNLEAVGRYFESVRGEQERLQQAIDSYRASTEQSRTTVERVAAARTLTDELVRGQQTLQAIQPPEGAVTAHETYLSGLSQEGLALQELLTFYGNYDVAAANRAALRLQDARSQIDAGKAGWDSFAAAHNATLEQTPPAGAGRRGALSEQE